MEITVTEENARVPISIIRITGNIDSVTHQTFQTKADELIDNGARYILIDLADVGFVSSAGLRALHNIFNRLRTIHRDVSDDELRIKMSTGQYKSPFIKIANPSSQIKEIFGVSGFDTYIESYNEVKKAISSFE